MGRHRAVSGHDRLEPTTENAGTSRHGCPSPTLPVGLEPCCWRASGPRRMHQIQAPCLDPIGLVAVAEPVRSSPDSAWRPHLTDLHPSFYREWYRRLRHRRFCPPEPEPAVCREPSTEAHSVLRRSWDRSEEVDRKGQWEVGMVVGTSRVVVGTLLSCVVEDDRHACNELVATVVLETAEEVGCSSVPRCTD